MMYHLKTQTEHRKELSLSASDIHIISSLSRAVWECLGKHRGISSEKSNVQLRAPDVFGGIVTADRDRGPPRLSEK